MSEITKPLAEWLRNSLRSGLLFGRFDEPLDAYGQRIVRVILSEVESASASAARPSGPDGSQAIGSATDQLHALTTIMAEVERQAAEIERLNTCVGDLLQSVGARESEARQALAAMQSLDVFYVAERERLTSSLTVLRGAMEKLTTAAQSVTKANEFQVIRRERERGDIEYQIFADTETPPDGVQVAYVQSTRHDAEFIALALELASTLSTALAVSPHSVSCASCGALRGALQQLRIDANRLCDRQLGGSYEADCRRSIAAADAALAVSRVPTASSPAVPSAPSPRPALPAAPESPTPRRGTTS